MVKKIIPDRIFNRFVAIFMSVILCFTIVSNNTKKVQAFDLVVTPTVVAVVACILVAIGVVDLSDGSADIATTALEFAEDCIDKGIDIVSWCNDCLSTADEFCEDVAKKGAIAVSSAALTTFVGWFIDYLSSKNFSIDVNNNIVAGVPYSTFSSVVDTVNNTANSFFDVSFTKKISYATPSNTDLVDNYIRFRIVHLKTFCDSTLKGDYYGFVIYGVKSSNTALEHYSGSFFKSDSLNSIYALPFNFSSMLVDMESIDNLFNLGLDYIPSSNPNWTIICEPLSDWYYNSDYVGEVPASTSIGIGVADSNGLTDTEYVGDLINNYGKDWTFDGTNDGVVVGVPVGLGGDIIDNDWSDKMVPGFGFPDVIDRSWTDVIGGVVDPDIPGTDVDTPDYSGVLGGIKSLIQSLLDALNGILDLLKSLVSNLVELLMSALSSLLVALFVPDVAITDRVYELIKRHIPSFSDFFLLDINSVEIPDVTLNGVVYVNNSFIRNNIGSFRLMLCIFISFLYGVHCILKFSKLLGKGE